MNIHYIFKSHTQKRKQKFAKKKIPTKKPLLSYETALFVEDFIGRKMSFILALSKSVFQYSNFLFRYSSAVQ